MRATFFLFFLLPILGSAQKFFKLQGEIDNPTEEKIIVTLYRNWVEPPEDYKLFLDANNRFSFETVLNEVAYLDINYGLNGILFQIIEPEDDLYLKFDSENFYESFHPTGKGSAKWIYYLNQRKKFEIEEDTERDLYAFIKKGKVLYDSKLKALSDKQLSLLESFKDYFSEDFFRLRRADILGRMNQYKLDFLISNNQTNDVLKQFELQSINTELQSKSFDFGYFIEGLLETHKSTLNSAQIESVSGDYALIKYHFGENVIGKAMAERLMATKISSYLDIDGYSMETETVIKDFSEFSGRGNYSEFLKRKIAVLKGVSLGEAAPNFVLTDTQGDFVSLKDFRGNKLLMIFWASWCEPCFTDLKYLPVIDNFFKKDEKLSILNIAVDSPSDFAEVVSKGRDVSISARVDPNSKFLKDYGVLSVPNYILLDENGNWLNNKLVEPSLDEGRALIKQLEEIFSTQ